MHNYEYVGCFFDPVELFEKVAPIRKNPLRNEKQKPHVTFAYAPDTVQTELFGEQVMVTIVGYGNNGENEGVSVTLSGSNEDINKMIERIPVPHITLAVSDCGQAVNTRFLHFTDIEPIRITAQFGGHIREED